MLNNQRLDFTLVKIEALEESTAAGDNLTTIGRENAERRALYRTARKLGHLLDDVAPSAPHLPRAYGLRVSEINEQKKKIDPTERIRHCMYHHGTVNPCPVRPRCVKLRLDECCLPVFARGIPKGSKSNRLLD
ncbi:hypothetical protein VB005_04664 [Metarhizium brunneum]